MNINYTYQKTQIIEKNIIRIEVAKNVLELLPQLPHIEETLRRKSLLKSSLFSAQIEGNTLEIGEIENSLSKDSQQKEKKEVFNILKTLKWLHSNYNSLQVTIEILLQLHSMVMESISYQAGKLRHEPSAIFNQAGVAIYMTPPPSQILDLLNSFITTINQSHDHPSINAAIAHFTFEKIHPFLDGNGRVGRIISSLILKNAGYGFRGLAVLEEYLNNHRETYYDCLSTDGKDITVFVEFFTKGVAESAELTINQLKDIKDEKPFDTLLPRRQEILLIIKDHQLVSFDFIKRRFPTIPKSTIHYDLSMLLKKGFIKKLGSTRGVLYSPK